MCETVSSLFVCIQTLLELFYSTDLIFLPAGIWTVAQSQHSNPRIKVKNQIVWSKRPRLIEWYYMETVCFGLEPLVAILKSYDTAGGWILSESPHPTMWLIHITAGHKRLIKNLWDTKLIYSPVCSSRLCHCSTRDVSWNDFCCKLVPAGNQLTKYIIYWSQVQVPSSLVRLYFPFICIYLCFSLHLFDRFTWQLLHTFELF